MGRKCPGGDDGPCIFSKHGVACQVQPNQTRPGPKHTHWVLLRVKLDRTIIVNVCGQVLLVRC